MNWRAAIFCLAIGLAAPAAADDIRATGDLGLLVERETGSLLLIDQSEHAAIGRFEGLGDLSHASLVYSPDQRFAYVFGRDGGLSKLDLVTQRVAGRAVCAAHRFAGDRKHLHGHNRFAEHLHVHAARGDAANDAKRELLQRQPGRLCDG